MSTPTSLRSRGSEGPAPFYDPVESGFYSYLVRSVMEGLATSRRSPVLTEVGSGIGLPVIDAMNQSGFTGRVEGWEINAEAAAIANAQAAGAGVAEQYVVNAADFFSHAHTTHCCLVSNPPYLPAQERHMTDPHLWGGPDGNTVIKRLLSAGYEMAVLVIPSLSDPVGVLAEAARLGYRVADWAIRPITMGQYCREQPVHERILELERAGRAFRHRDVYSIGGVTFTTEDGPDHAELALRALLAVASAT